MCCSSAPLLRQHFCNDAHSMMNDELSQRILAALTRMPDWLRRDLSTKDDASRQRAEEALSAIIVSALNQHADG